MDVELYLARTQAEPRGACRPGKGALATTLGAFHWSFLLGEDAAGGWAGDCVTVEKGEGVFEIGGTSAWDSDADASEFAKGLETFLARRSVKKSAVDKKGTTVAFRWTVPL